MTKREARTVRLPILLTESEARALGRRASSLGMTRSRLIREYGLQEGCPAGSVRIDVPAEAVQALLDALQRFRSSSS